MALQKYNKTKTMFICYKISTTPKLLETSTKVLISTTVSFWLAISNVEKDGRFIILQVASALRTAELAVKGVRKAIPPG